MGDSPNDTASPPWSEGASEQDDGPSAAELEAAGQSAMFGGDTMPDASAPAPAPSPAAKDTGQPYRVLARKYRPQTFSELIGQDAMVRTLANAIERDRLAHAFLMTGVRGVGKTSTARLIAKALNCIGPDGQGGPTIDPCGECEPCVAIAEGRHIDVIEMDAASNTGVDDVREIIEAVRYAAVSARYKIYIVDEVHMLSRNAFNALLKTLEEPPAHVKFLFATTEVDKLPVTVLSRTQRFDLKRIPAELLREHFARVCEAEGVGVEDEALAMIAAAAEGSVRDGLSILDQAIAHADLEGEGAVSAARVGDMLGLADTSARRALFGSILAGEGKALLEKVAEQYALGVEPLALIKGQMELAHRVVVAQVSGKDSLATSAEEARSVEEWAAAIQAPKLHRLWQLLLKGYEEVRMAPDPLASLQMALLRTLNAAELPDPGDLARKLEELASRPVPASTNENSQEGTPAPAAALDWAGLRAQVEAAGFLTAAMQMHDAVRVIECTPGKLVYDVPPGFPDPGPDLRDALARATGERWQVLRGEGGLPSLREQAEAHDAEAAAALRKHPMVEAAFAAFPDAEMVEDDARPSGSDGREQWSRHA